MLDRGSAGEESGSSSRPWTLTSTDLYLDSAGPPCSNSAAMAWSHIQALDADRSSCALTAVSLATMGSVLFLRC